MGVGKKLQELLAERGTNPNELASKTGISAQTIYSLIKRDASKMEIDSLIKICHALGVNVEYFSDSFDDEPKVIAAHLDTEDLTETELDDVANYIEFIKAKRK